MFGRALWFAALSLSLQAQSVIPSKAGLVSYADDAQVENRPINTSSTGNFLVDDSAVLRVRAGHAEVLLGPCAALWIDKNSSFRMISSALDNVRIELLTGSAIVASGGRSELTMLLGTSQTILDHAGAFRFSTQPEKVQVLSGRTSVEWSRRVFALTAGKWLPLIPEASVHKFKRQTPDQLAAWANHRASLLSHLSTEQPQRPAEVSSPGVYRDTLDHPRMVPGVGGDDLSTVHAQLPPLPKNSPSGCRISPWLNEKHEEKEHQ